MDVEVHVEKSHLMDFPCYFFFREGALHRYDGKNLSHSDSPSPEYDQTTRKGDLRYAKKLLSDIGSTGIATDNGTIVIGDGRSDWLLFRNLETIAEAEGSIMPLGLFHECDEFFDKVERSQGARFFTNWEDLVSYFENDLISQNRNLAVDIHQTLLFPKDTSGSALKSIHEGALHAFVDSYYIGDKTALAVEDLCSLESETLSADSLLMNEGERVVFNNAEAHALTTLLVCSGVIDGQWLKMGHDLEASYVDILEIAVRSLENGSWVFLSDDQPVNGSNIWSAEALHETSQIAYRNSLTSNPLICPSYRKFEHAEVFKSLTSPSQEGVNRTLLRALSNAPNSSVVFVTDKPLASLEGSCGFVLASI